MTDEQKALLGDHEAAKRLTEQGVLVPCPGCGWTGPMRDAPTKARLAWNTRAPILSAEEMEMLNV